MVSALDLGDLAAEQWGLVTTAQARALGISAQSVARLAERGTLERITHGVHRVTGAPPGPLDEIRAAWLALDPNRRAGDRLTDETPAVVSHRSAAALHQLGDLDADRHEFTLTGRKQSRRPDVRLHRGTLTREDWTIVNGLPVTTTARTIDDLAAARTDGGHLAGVVRDAITTQKIDDTTAAAILRRHAHHYGARLGDGEGLLTRLLQEAGMPASVERAIARTTNADALAAIAKINHTMDKVVADLNIGGQAEALARTLAPLTRQIDEIKRSMAPFDEIAAAVSRISAPYAEITRQLEDNPALKAAARLQVSPSLKAIEQIQNSAVFKVAEQIQNGPSLKAAEQLSRKMAQINAFSAAARTSTSGPVDESDRLADEPTYDEQETE